MGGGGREHRVATREKGWTGESGQTVAREARKKRDNGQGLKLLQLRNGTHTRAGLRAWPSYNERVHAWFIFAVTPRGASLSSGLLTRSARARKPAKTLGANHSRTTSLARKFHWEKVRASATPLTSRKKNSRALGDGRAKKRAKKRPLGAQCVAQFACDSQRCLLTIRFFYPLQRYARARRS